MNPSLGVETYKYTGDEYIYGGLRTMARLMARLSRALVLLSLLGGTLFVGTAAAARATDPSLRSLKRLDAVKRWEYSARGRNGPSADPRRSTETSTPSRVKNITFTNTRASGEYAWARTLPRLFVSRASRVLRKWRNHTPSQL